ncbi:hypothetical protein JAAARDRAFT_36412 [Jaapia argillacea MUCL 33604]|uniref:Shugoshin C-terminal domain-containing protein n=1 Tax=Jaapia argillacea MUCL 33604 TaxID=933084 RepID=A0A067PQZ2_9AGAM|nr:hypothetical protein JAAARDRAFT_36412 [Jaapia argillacea MUCL 33604]
MDDNSILQRLKDEIHNLHIENERLVAENELLTHRRDEFQADLAKLRQICVDSRNKEDVLKVENDRLRLENGDLKRKLGALPAPMSESPIMSSPPMSSRTVVGSPVTMRAPVAPSPPPGSTSTMDEEDDMIQKPTKKRSRQTARKSTGGKPPRKGPEYIEISDS